MQNENFEDEKPMSHWILKVVLFWGHPALLEFLSTERKAWPAELPTAKCF